MHEPGSKPLITVVSCGPGGAEFLTDAARSAVASSEVIAGTPRLFQLFPDSKAEQIPMAGGVENLLDRIEPLTANKRVSVLVSGDAGLHSLAKGVRQRFGRDHCRTIPGISSVQVACARLNIPWQNAEVINVHHTDDGPELASLPKREVYIVLSGPSANWVWIKQFRTSLGDEFNAFLLQDLSLAEESIEELPKEFNGGDVSPRTIVVLADRRVLD